jgi:hypothetical protein
VSASARRPHHPALYALFSSIAVVLIAIGFAAGLGSQITKGSMETGQGAYVTERPLAYWTWHATVLGTIPAAVPPRASTTSGAPTLLPRVGRSYTINAAVAGQTSVAWTFQQTTAAPRAAELVITFVDGLSSTTSTIVVYVETNARALAAPARFVFYWDAGAFAPGTLTIETMTATVQACAAIGNCP